ncbi:hypothetical protein [Sulfidibacter corallicola]|uniref:Uncharacterized protein n=1 Tax=Sulfidibacter corallicola TaxID=2818388 RepID=A0A8A4TYC4_SULCO|nr:hypothetical protein [Sulfidibacter corallicola]QTD54228.1 hypothetical protein J3U87_17420 [Sulfidibacter corallicola]
MAAASMTWRACAGLARVNGAITRTATQGESRPCITAVRPSSGTSETNRNRLRTQL